ncbi:MAG: glycosyltransferase family 4 protein [Wenzhouxiangella sp.]|nr:glycosyltransferase family 4 protein [Wenzhouxiangella sp.]
MAADLMWPLVMAAVLTALLGWPLRAWLTGANLVDQPDHRRSHRRPTPRGGGLAMVLAMAFVLVLAGGVNAEIAVVIFFTAGLAFLGWTDDVRDLAVRWRLLAQLLIALAMLLFTGPVGSVQVFGLTLNWPWLWSALGLVAVVWLINLHNFMDGSDGLAALQGIWTGLVMGTLMAFRDGPTAALVGFTLAGACLGFLWWNRPTARLFMGDTGSVTLGGLVALLALTGAAEGRVSVWLSLIVCSVFVVDATATLLRRVGRGARWYTPHREHLYQRLIAGGWSHARVLVLYAMVNLLVVLPVVLLAIRFPAWEMILALALTALLAAGWSFAQASTTKENLS